MQDPNDPKRKLDDARSRYQANRKYLDDRRSALQSVAGLNDGQNAHIFRRLRYTSEDTIQEERLRPQFVEPILQQATGLVDRVLAEDPVYRQLRIDQLNLQLDLQELEALQAINDEEVAAGLFDVPFWEANTALESDKALKKAQADLASWVQQKADTQRKLAAWATENAQQPLATGWEGKLSQHQTRLFGGYAVPSEQVPAGAKPTDGNIIGGLLSYQIADYNFSYQQQQLSLQSAPIDARAVPLDARVAYLKADAGFKERRKIAAHEKLVGKLRAVQYENGPLNYSARIAAIEERAAVDLRHAYRRLRVMRRGIKQIYGVDAPELPLIRQGPDASADVDFLDKIVDWIRSTSLMLQDFYNNDQEFTITLQLAELMAHGRFHEAAKRGSIEFEVTPDRFDGFKLIRLRGLSAVAHAGCHRSYSIIASAPKETSLIYGSSLATIAQRVDSCWLGRVVSRSQIRPDIYGSRVLWNASPLGHWRIIPAPVTNLEHLKDLELHFHIVAQRIT